MEALRFMLFTAGLCEVGLATLLTGSMYWGMPGAVLCGALYLWKGGNHGLR